jgi:hypothetical protein
MMRWMVERLTLYSSATSARLVVVVAVVAAAVDRFRAESRSFGCLPSRRPFARA